MFSTNTNRKNVVGKSSSRLLFDLCLSVSLTSLCLDLCSSRRAFSSRAYLTPLVLPSYRPVNVALIVAMRSVSPLLLSRFMIH